MGRYDSKPNALIGKTLRDIQLAGDEQAIKFIMLDGTEIVAHCDGDCCSNTWVEDVTNPEFALGAEILSAEDIEMPEGWTASPTKHEDHYEEVMQYYGFKIATAKGVCTIEYRNSSNGYYGGNLSWPGEGYYGGAFGQNDTKGDWRSCVAESQAGSPI
jgi:hypothetical protein